MRLADRRVAIFDHSFDLTPAPAAHPLLSPQTRAFYQESFLQTTAAFIQYLDDHLILWVDHHPHNCWLNYRKDPRFVLADLASIQSCAQILTTPFCQDIFNEVDTILAHNDLDGLLSAARFLLAGVPPYPAALMDAVAADTRVGELSELGKFLDDAIHEKPDNQSMNLALEFLLSGAQSRPAELIQLSQSYASRTQVESLPRQRLGNCLLADARQCQPSVDIHAELVELQQSAPVAILLHHAAGRQLMTIATRAPGLNLPALLGLPGGSPHKVTLDGGHLDEAVSLINQALSPAHVLNPPREATIEITRRCNLRCTLCPIGTRVARSMPDMDIHLFTSLLATFGSRIERLCLHHYGEPCLHPQLAEFIRHAKDAGIPFVFFSTNGNYLPPELAGQLVSSGLDLIRFSIDTSDPQAYTQYRVGGNLPAVLHNMRGLRAVRDAAGQSTPVIEAQALITLHNEMFVDDFRQVMLDHGADRVRYKTVNLYMAGFISTEEGQEYLPENADYSRYRENHPLTSAIAAELKPCRWAEESLVVLADGTLVPCCQDFNGDHPLGKAGLDCAEEIWDTPARRAFIDRRTNQPGSIPMCWTCSLANPNMDARKLVDIPVTGGGV
jgi:MoaA/NifB/PqqE/SkfB family radical SAM enzyme